MIAKIRKDDMVRVLSGKEKGKVGVVLKIVRSGTAVVIEGLNKVKKSVRRNPQTGEEGGYKSKESPIDISNVAYYDGKTEQAVKIGVKKLPDGSKIRYNKRSGTQIDTEDKK